MNKIYLFLFIISLSPLVYSQNKTTELKGYDGFKVHLDGMSPYSLRGCVTPFIGIDYGFASTRFAVYI